MASLREQVDSILREQPNLPSNDAGRILSRSQSAAGSDGSSDNGSEGSDSTASVRDSRTEAVSPESASADSDNGNSASNSGASRSRSRRSKPGSDSSASSNTRSSSRSQQAASFNLGDLVLLLNNCIAYALSESELLIEQEEANQLGEAMQRLMKYSKSVKLTPLQLAWLNFGATLLIVYGVRIWNILQRRWKDKKDKIINVPRKEQTQ